VNLRAIAVLSFVILLIIPLKAQLAVSNKSLANLTTIKEIPSFPSASKFNFNLLNSNKLVYLDYQYIFGYTHSPNYISAMNMHPEFGLGIGSKKDSYSLGITGTYRFIKTRKPYDYYFSNDTLNTRYFGDLAFSFYYHKPLIEATDKEVFFEIGTGFELLYLERTARSASQSRPSTISFHGMGGIGYRLTRKNLKYYQLGANINYNNFSLGKNTDIPGQFFFNIRFTIGYLVKDDWAMMNGQK
jgi:hypothetical protein